MPPLFTEKPVTTVAEYVDALSGLPHDRILWYRGQTNANKPLKPGLARRAGKDWISAEPMLLTRFRQNALPLVPSGTKTDTDWDWLLLMQHYGVPTRLLDWSENALAGLYFATVSFREGPNRTDGCVWVLDPLGLNKESNIPALADAIPTLGVGVALAEYLPDAVASTIPARPPVAVLAMRMFPRLVAQSAVFTLVHKERTPLERVKGGAYVGRILVPRGAKRKIATALKDMGITRLSLFPELESAALLAKGYLK